MKDLNKNQRQFNYWLRRNKDRFLFAGVIIVFILGFWILPALGLYIIS
jgi:hypothetical protein